MLATRESRLESHPADQYQMSQMTRRWSPRRLAALGVCNTARLHPSPYSGSEMDRETPGRMNVAGCIRPPVLVQIGAAGEAGRNGGNYMRVTLVLFGSLLPTAPAAETSCKHIRLEILHTKADVQKSTSSVESA
jgi:hypothetical protein